MAGTLGRLPGLVPRRVGVGAGESWRDRDHVQQAVP
jgi:hypothetical protein